MMRLRNLFVLWQTSAPVAIPIREIEGESATDQQISQLRECISTGDWGEAPPQYNMLEMNSLPLESKY